MAIDHPLMYMQQAHLNAFNRLSEQVFVPRIMQALRASISNLALAIAYVLTVKHCFGMKKSLLAPLPRVDLHIIDVV